MYKIKLVNDLWVDLDNIPDDFGKKVKAAFERYTEDTNEDYRYEDKLAFVDLCVKRLKGDKSDDKIVKDLIMRNVEYMLEDDELPSVNDYNSIEFMRNCVEEGRDEASLIFRNGGGVAKTEMRVLDMILTALYGG